MKTIQLSERELSIVYSLMTPPYRAEDIRSDEFNELRNKVFYALRDARNDEPVSQPYKLPVGWVAVPVEPTEEMLNAWLSEVANWRGHVAGYKAMLAAAMEEKLKVNMARQWPEPKDGEPRLHIKEAGNSPVTPDGYVLVPKKLTAENGAKSVLSGEFSETKFINCPECFGDDECETCDGSGRIEITVPVTWTTIKEIWAKGAEHFAAAQQKLIPTTSNDI